MVIKKDIAIIGGGPGGYAAALRCAQFGKRVILFEEDAVGGTCMNYGCIPTKSLLHQTQMARAVRTSRFLGGPVDWVGCDWARAQEEKKKAIDRLVRGIEFLLQRNGVELIRARAMLGDERRILVRSAGEENVYEAQKIILASGSRPAELSFLKTDGTAVVTSREALEFDAVPKSLLIVGAGAVGLEMGTIYSRMGTEVVVLEILATALPGCDREMGARLERTLRVQGLKVLTQMKIDESLRRGAKTILRGTCLKDRKPFELEAERILVAAGRRPNSDTIQDGPIVAVNRAGCVLVNNKLETSVPGIYAIGDLVGGKFLAHKASHEGLAAAANAVGGSETVDDRALPMAIFTEPEFASVGWTEEEARSRLSKVHIGTFSFQANARAVTLHSPEGLVKVVAGPDERIVGAHILGPSASELLAELVLAVRQGLKITDIAGAVHIHPTLSEAVMEAAMKAKGQAIHALN
jgi:dihydrolipoamide dehydrogenase